MDQLTTRSEVIQFESTLKTSRIMFFLFFKASAMQYFKVGDSLQLFSN
jgi:hypothetical protein